jgi:hypothetical protein
MRRNRGQLVVLAAAALAIALVPMALAYLQLGYHEDVRTSPEEETLTAIDRTLSRALVTASDDVPATYDWDERSAAVTSVRDALAPSLSTLRRSGLDSGTAVRITYNDSRAQAWERTNCPGGPARDFGPCRADRGVVVQERAGQTHVLAVAVDVSVTQPDATRNATLVVRTTAGS